MVIVHNIDKTIGTQVVLIDPSMVIVHNIDKTIGTRARLIDSSMVIVRSIDKTIGTRVIFFCGRSPLPFAPVHINVN
ncbi:MAG: hypothetical protein WBA76_10950 [Phormidesmis sp.]